MSFWSKLGKIGLMAAPFIPIPGMQALGPLASGLIKGGIGAASGAVSGGKKGALLGGALGGALGGFGGKSGGFGGDTVDGMSLGDIESGAASGGGAGGGISGFLGKMSKAGLDPTTLALGGMSMLGGPSDNLKSNDKTSIDPVTRMTEALDALKQSSANIASRGPTQLRSSFVPAPPAAINVPGVPFQIGGGLGRDPALDNPALLEGAAPQNPFAPGAQQAQLRKPKNANS